MHIVTDAVFCLSLKLKFDTNSDGKESKTQRINIGGKDKKLNCSRHILDSHTAVPNQELANHRQRNIMANAIFAKPKV